MSCDDGIIMEVIDAMSDACTMSGAEQTDLVSSEEELDEARKVDNS